LIFRALENYKYFLLIFHFFNFNFVKIKKITFIENYYKIWNIPLVSCFYTLHKDYVSYIYIYIYLIHYIVFISANWFLVYYLYGLSVIFPLV